MRLRRVLGAAVVLALAGLLGPQTAPLYDGVGFPDEPYRFVQPPPGSVIKTTPPTSIVITVPVVGGTTDGFNAASGEQGPQVSLFVPVKALLAPAGAHRITVKVVPQAPDGPADGGSADGNVYRFTAASDTGVPSVAAAGDHLQIVLRATTARQPGPVMEYRTLGGQTWRRLSTLRYGNDVYAAAAPGFGDYALVFATPTKAPSTSHDSAGSGRLWLGLVLGGLLAVLVAILVAVRVSRSRRRG